MVTQEDIESFLFRMQLEHEQPADDMWLVQTNGEDGVRLVVHHSPPILLLRLKVLEVPEDERQCAELYRRLLELNATDLLHASYGIEDEDVILYDTLELENLDFNEVQASVDSMQMALASHREQLSPYRNC
jgi:hypothetical protein